jgi:hypothetical protein
MAGALIVTAELGSSDLAWLDRLRRAHYPADRNLVPAHLTVFHALPPSAEAEVRSTLSRYSSEKPPRATIEGVLNLGSGVAFRVVSSDLDRIRRELSGHFHGLMGAQDAGGWRPHITIQNKVSANEVRALIADLEREFRPRSLAISGLGLHRYLDGPWERLVAYPFRGR